MDHLHRELFTVLMDKSWAHSVAQAVDVTLLGRFYERFADHAVSVAKRTVFVVTGRMPGSDQYDSCRREQRRPTVTTNQAEPVGSAWFQFNRAWDCSAGLRRSAQPK